MCWWVVLWDGISSSELRGLFDVGTSREGRREFRWGVRELEREAEREACGDVGWWLSFKDSVGIMF